MDKPRIVNLNELPPATDREHGEKFASSHVPIGAPLGAKKLGYNLTEIPPGKCSFPYHFHYVNEELFLILSGTGDLRWPGGRTPLKAMDLICCPPGPDSAHQILNNGSVPLRYLALSTNFPVVGYAVLSAAKLSLPRTLSPDCGHSKTYSSWRRRAAA